MSAMTGKGDPAVSTVVGELLMLAVVLVMVGALVVQSGALTPAGRAPVVTILMNATTGDHGTVMLWHKGGDYVRTDQVSLTLGNDLYTLQDPLYPNNTPKLTFFAVGGEKTGIVFDLGGRIQVNDIAVYEGERVRLSTPETVLFTGTVGP